MYAQVIDVISSFIIFEIYIFLFLNLLIYVMYLFIISFTYLFLTIKLFVCCCSFSRHMFCYYLFYDLMIFIITIVIP